jgi:ubiquitin-protein ligase
MPEDYSRKYQLICHLTCLLTMSRFDLFLPPEYPVNPPKMAFVLNGNDGDAYSFNPNLHVGGTGKSCIKYVYLSILTLIVCLSILNTWSGMPQEMWQPNKSTLLAVLVSVQAMILGAPYPWHNEPGHEKDGLSNQVKENKMVVQAKTLRHAMIAWIENIFDDGKAKEHIWKDISQTYWKNNGRKVLSEVVTWADGNPHLLDFSAGLPYPFGPKRGRAKSSSNGQGVNLINKLAVSLGLQPPYEEDEPEEKKKKLGILGRLKGKRKVSDSDLNIAHHLKKQKSESAHSGEKFEFEQKWVYTGTVNQKESRAACKDFGIGAASSIKGTIEKLEKHVNEKGKANPALMEKWGKSIFVEESDLEATSSKSWGDNFSDELPDHMPKAPWAE